jgi:hypothetical protein
LFLLFYYFFLLTLLALQTPLWAAAVLTAMLRLRLAACVYTFTFFSDSSFSTLACCTDSPVGRSRANSDASSSSGAGRRGVVSTQEANEAAMKVPLMGRLYWYVMRVFFFSLVTFLRVFLCAESAADWTPLLARGASAHVTIIRVLFCFPFEVVRVLL